MSNLKDRALTERVTLPFDDSHLWSPEGRLRIIDRTPGKVKRAGDKSIQLVYRETQLTPRLSRFGLGFSGPRESSIPEITNTDSPISTGATANGSSVTFAGASIGAADGARTVLVIAQSNTAAVTTTVTNITVAGNSTTLAVATSGGQIGIAARYLALALGTTADVVVTHGNTGGQSSLNMSCVVYRVLNVTSVLSSSAPAQAGATTSMTLNSNTLNNTVGAALGLSVSGTNRTFTWTGLTEDVDEIVETTQATQSAASAAFTATESPRSISYTLDAAPTRHRGVCVVFQ